MIEMIGVMAVMAILASVVVPNVLKSIERAAVRAEVETLRNLGEQAKLYLRNQPPAAVIPLDSVNWTTRLATYASLNPADIATNRRQVARVYATDPATQRAMIVSSMRTGITIPAFVFNNVWNWVESSGVRPTGFPASWDNYLDYLVVERINFTQVYNTELQRYEIALTNKTNGALTMGGPIVPSAPASYQITRAGAATPEAFVNIGAQATTSPPLGLYPRDRISLYRGNGAVAANLDLTYVVSASGKTFYFDGAHWIPQ